MQNIRELENGESNPHELCLLKYRLVEEGNLAKRKFERIVLRSRPNRATGRIPLLDRDLRRQRPYGRSPRGPWGRS